MKVFDVIIGAVDLQHSNVVIEGIFVMKKDLGYIIDDESHLEKHSAAVKIAVPNLKQILRGKVPSLGGSEFSHFYKAKLSGVLTQKDTSEFPCEINEISHFAIFAHDEEFIVIA